MSIDPTPQGSDLDLPWYATGRLDAEAVARLEAEIGRDPALARHLEVARDERSETVALNETLGSPSAAARTALFARIDADRPRTAPARGVLERIATLLSRLSPPSLALASLAALALIVVQGSVLTGLWIGGDTRFTTASAPGTAPAPGEILLVGFVPTASSSAVVALLHDQHATVVSGPKPGGLFEVRVAAQPLSAPDRDAVIARFKAQTGVVQFVAAEGGTP